MGKYAYLVLVRNPSSFTDLDPGSPIVVCITRELAESEAEYLRTEGGWAEAWVENIDFISDAQELTENA